MGNLMGRIKSNWFAVRDAEQFKTLLDRCESESPIIIQSGEKDGVILHSFSCAGLMSGLNNDDGEGMTEFLEALQPLIEDQNAVIITEIGFEGDKHVSGRVYVATQSHILEKSLRDSGIEAAREMLGDAGYDIVEI